MKKGFFSLGFIFLSLSLFVCWRLFLPLNFKDQVIIIDAPPGKTFYSLAKDLENKQLIRSHWDMRFLIQLFGEPFLQKGEYEFSPSQSLWSIFQNLREGKDRDFLIQFPEGLNHYEMGEILKAHDWPATENFLKEVWNKNFIKKTLNKDFDSFEGYLFPESYRIKKYMTAQSLIAIMIKNFLNVYQKLSVRQTERSFTRHEVVTLASLIEKETGLPEERSLIAGVFYNRLKMNMKLQTDPSVLYALYLIKGFNIKKNIRKKDLIFPSSYNTYFVKGLPPGPIANPGEKSLEAVFSPKESNYLYFVSRNDGSHKFSETFKEHQKAVQKYQIEPFKKKPLSNKKINPQSFRDFKP